MNTSISAPLLPSAVLRATAAEVSVDALIAALAPKLFVLPSGNESSVYVSAGLGPAGVRPALWAAVPSNSAGAVAASIARNASAGYAFDIMSPGSTVSTIIVRIAAGTLLAPGDGVPGSPTLLTAPSPLNAVDLWLAVNYTPPSRYIASNATWFEANLVIGGVSLSVFSSGSAGDLCASVAFALGLPVSRVIIKSVNLASGSNSSRVRARRLGLQGIDAERYAIRELASGGAPSLSVNMQVFTSALDGSGAPPSSRTTALAASFIAQAASQSLLANFSAPFSAGAAAVGAPAVAPTSASDPALCLVRAAASGTPIPLQQVLSPSNLPNAEANSYSPLSGLSWAAFGGVVAGIVVGIVFVIALALYLCLCCRSKPDRSSGMDERDVEPVPAATQPGSAWGDAVVEDLPPLSDGDDVHFQQRRGLQVVHAAENDSFEPLQLPHHREAITQSSGYDEPLHPYGDDALKSLPEDSFGRSGTASQLGPGTGTESTHESQQPVLVSRTVLGSPASRPRNPSSIRNLRRANPPVAALARGTDDASASVPLPATAQGHTGARAIGPLRRPAPRVRLEPQ